MTRLIIWPRLFASRSVALMIRMFGILFVLLFEDVALYGRTGFERRGSVSPGFRDFDWRHGPRLSSMRR